MIKSANNSAVLLEMRISAGDRLVFYADQGSCTSPYQSTVLDIADVEPGCICFRVIQTNTTSIQRALELDASCI